MRVFALLLALAAAVAALGQRGGAAESATTANANSANARSGGGGGGATVTIRNLSGGPVVLTRLRPGESRSPPFTSARHRGGGGGGGDDGGDDEDDNGDELEGGEEVALDGVERGARPRRLTRARPPESIGDGYAPSPSNAKRAAALSRRARPSARAR
jgi:hypothetical protein